MTAVTNPLSFFADANGNAVESGFIYVGYPHARDNPIQLYWDSALTIPALQPVRTIAGYPVRDGSPAQIFANEPLWVMTLLDGDNVPVFTNKAAPFIDGSIALRAELESNGFDMIGNGVVTLEERLDIIEADLTDTSGVVDATFPAIIPLTATPRFNIGRASQLAIAQSYLMNNVGNSITHIGDSTSHGAYSGNAYTQHWVMGLQRATAAEYGGRNIGFMPMEGVYNSIPSLNTPQLISAVFTGDWGARHPTNPAPYDYPQGLFGLAAADSINGKLYPCTVIGAKLTLTMPTICERLILKYTSRVGGGRFSITVNGVAAGNLFTFLDGNGNAAVATTHNVSYVIPLVDNGKGTCVVELTKTTDTNLAELNAVAGLFSAENVVNVFGPRVAFSNFSQSGRTLSHMSTNAIINACNSRVLSIALGRNDQSAAGLNTDGDNTAFALFQTKINEFITYANVFNCLVIVHDFMWDVPPTSRTRHELMRLARATRGNYISYPDDFFANGRQPIPSPSELNTPMFLFADLSHPGPEFQGAIMARMATELNYNVRSLDYAVQHHDWWYPIPIAHADFSNVSPTSIRSLSAIRRTGGRNFEVRLNMKHTAATLPPATLFDIFTALPEKFRGADMLELLPTSYPLGFTSTDVAGAVFFDNETMRVQAFNASLDFVRTTVTVGQLS